MDTFKNGWIRVGIPIKDGKDSDRLFKLEQEKLWNRGISFDTGAGFGFRDWELDWSLEGATPEEVMAILDKEGIDYEVRQVPDGILD